MKTNFTKLFNRIRTNFNKNRVLNVGIIIAWIFIVVLTLYLNHDALGKISSGNETYFRIARKFRSKTGRNCGYLCGKWKNKGN